MEYITYKPSEKLKDFIKFFWVFETDGKDNIPYHHLATASGCAKLAFQYGGAMGVRQPSGANEKLFTSGIQAQSQRAQQFISSGEVGVIGVYFQPYALPFLFGIPAEDLSNQNIALDDLLGRQGRELEEQVMSASSNRDRLSIISTFFEKRLASASGIYPNILSTINYIVESKGMVGINDLIQRNFLSQRQFERRFKALTGFSPKMFCRITRFESSLDLFQVRDVSLTDTAYTLGYYDQSHFIRDFREFAGEHPSAYFSQDWSLFSPA